ncbi:MAG: thioesterase [Muribaculum sp.]|nr:thioesterase [Muribaculum sp.]
MKEFTENFFLSAGEADAEKEMALPLLVSKLIDIATAHANALGIGNPNMPDPDTGWVLSRLTTDMERYPRVNESYSITTWIESWNRHFSQRAFMIADKEGNPLGYARSIWMVLNTKTRANAGLTALNLPPDSFSDRVCPIPKQLKHEKIGNGGLLPSHPDTHYRFKYCDLDSYRHVNTVRYVQLLLNQLPLETYDKFRMSRLELSFLHEARYGMEVTIRRADSPLNNLHTAFYIEDQEQTPILYARTLFSNR